jgi:hypothetical protein
MWMKLVTKTMTLPAGDAVGDDVDLPGVRLHTPYCRRPLFRRGHHLQNLHINVSTTHTHTQNAVLTTAQRCYIPLASFIADLYIHCCKACSSAQKLTFSCYLSNCMQQCPSRLSYGTCIYITVFTKV